MIQNPPVGLLSLLPLYVALATGLGFVDFRVRTHHDRSLAYIASVISGAEEAPGRYRVLAPYTFEGLTRLTRLEPSQSWLLFRWLCLLATFLTGHLYFRTWFEIGPAVAGNLLMAALLPLTFTNSWAHPDHFAELLLFSLACACLIRGWDWGFAGALALNALNRETSVFLVLLFLFARPFDRRHVLWSAGLGALWLAIWLALRWQLGFVTYDPWQVKRNLEFLTLLPKPYDPYYRMFAWFVAFLAVPLFGLVAATWRIQNRLNKVAAAIVAPAFMLVAFLFASIIETRIFTPLLPLLIPAVLTALFTRADVAAPVARG